MREAGPERPDGARDFLTRNTGGTTHERPQSIRRHPPRPGIRPRGTSPRVRFTVFALGLGTGVGLLGGIWFWAALWSFLAALAGVLLRGFRQGDWSAFRRYELDDGGSERFDWSTRTGRYAYLRDHDDLSGHGPIT